MIQEGDEAAQHHAVPPPVDGSGGCVRDHGLAPDYAGLSNSENVLKG